MKYGNKKTTVDGITFDSKAEAKRYAELVMLEKAGHIANLRRQVVYVLAPRVRIDGEDRARPELRYVADFEYAVVRGEGAGRRIVEDVKGVQTPVFRIKRHLMKSVFGIDVKVTR